MADAGRNGSVSIARGTDAADGHDGSALARILGATSGVTGPIIGLLLLCVFLSIATDSFLSLRNFLQSYPITTCNFCRTPPLVSY